MPDHLTDPDFWAGLRDWLIGLGTLGTLAVSVVVLKRQGDEIEAQAQERRDEAEYRRSEQARNIRLSTGSRKGGGFNKQYRRHLSTVAVFNGSSEAVHDVVLDMQVVGSVTPDEGALWEPTTAPLLEVGETLTHLVKVRAPWEPDRDDYQQFEVRPRVEFTDMAGQRWERDYEHRLRRIST